MQLTRTLSLAPGECYHCGSIDGPFVDTLKEDVRGRIYVCAGCVQLMANLLGLTDEERVAARTTKLELAAAKAELAQEQQTHLELRKAVLLTLKTGAVTRHGSIVLRQRNS